MYKAKLVTGTGQITGSIAKFQAVGDYNSQAVIDQCEWGTYSSDGTTAITNTISTDFGVPNGSSVEGPICQLKLTSGTILAYIND
tara:strand:- start:921 stop:1175 length:255 start_codon:yes stop_codon:yes gene_type:complete